MHKPVKSQDLGGPIHFWRRERLAHVTLRILLDHGCEGVLIRCTVLKSFLTGFSYSCSFNFENLKTE